MGEAFRVDSPQGMLEFFLSAAGDVHRYISRLAGGDEQLTEDIVQETFIALLKHHRAGEDATMRVGWLMTTARHRLIDHVRARQRELARLERHLAGGPTDSPPVDSTTTPAEHARWMLQQLPLAERVALGLHTLDGLSVAEIASLLDRSEEATTSLLARARRRLRVVMTEGDDG